MWTGSSWQRVPRWDEEAEAAVAQPAKLDDSSLQQNLTAPFHSAETPAVPICRRILMDGYLAIQK